MKLTTDIELRSLLKEDRAASDISSILVSLVFPPGSIANEIRPAITLLRGDSPSEAEVEAFGLRA
jgi:hypothetical protein